MTRPADGCVIDLDGTLYVGDTAVPGAAEAIGHIRQSRTPICFATNTTRRPRSSLVERLADMGIPVLPEELFTAPVAAARWLSDRTVERVSLLLPEATFEEFGEFQHDHEAPDYVVVGDLAEDWTFEVLNRGFRALMAGARLVAIHKNRSWDPGSGLQLDAGPFVTALEFASGQQAEVIGKPSAAFFQIAAKGLGVPLGRVAVVGDSPANDVAGGQAAGCLGVAVRTGTFRENQLEELIRPPDAILDSIADLPRWLGI